MQEIQRRIKILKAIIVTIITITFLVPRITAINPGPELAFSPQSHDFGTISSNGIYGQYVFTSFSIWNSGDGLLTCQILESCPWLTVSQNYIESTGDPVEVVVNASTLGLSPGQYTYDIQLLSNGGDGIFRVFLTVTSESMIGTIAEKTVRCENGSWGKTTNASKNEIIRFRIYAYNAGTVVVAPLEITDFLPASLIYIGNETIEPSYIHGNEIRWNISWFQPNDNLTIEFDAQTTLNGIYTNRMEYKAYMLNGGCYGWDYDEATVIVGNNALEVEINGPYSGYFGERFYFNGYTSGGEPPYDWYFYRGDGSGGTGGYAEYFGNKNQTYNVAVVATDSGSNITYDSTRTYIQLPTDSTIFVNKSVKYPNSIQWQKQVTARVGDILNIKISVKTVGSQLLHLAIIDEETPELSYVNGSASILPDQYTPGQGHWGDSLYWENIETPPGTELVITFDTIVMKEFCGWAYTEGMAWNTVMVYASVGDNPYNYIAGDIDGITIEIVKDPGSIFYVGGSGGGNYSYIQDAINAAANGDTIIVYPGTYREHLTINKTITLKGQGELKTFIDSIGLSTAVEITAKGVTISGFTIQNAIHCGISVDSVNNTIMQNIIFNNGQEGLSLYSDNNIVINNKIRNNNHGIIISSGYNLIKGNTITNNQVGVIIISEQHANDIYDNNFIRNMIHASDINYWSTTWNGYSFPERKYVGNYWDTYTGVDADGDGFSDTPYTYITHGESGSGIVLDLYPYMHPCLPICGDTNADGTIDVGDVVYLINYLFIGGPEPKPQLCVGDANGDGIVDVCDLVYLINYLFEGGPAPFCC